MLIFGFAGVGFIATRRQNQSVGIRSCRFVRASGRRALVLKFD
jgi:hypothetical protein